MNTSVDSMRIAACEVAVCGAGPVGMALAALLVQRGLAPDQILLVDGKTVAQSERDPRSIALSYGSRQLLEQIQAWPGNATPIRQIHVSRRGHFGRTLIDAEEYGLSALGYVVRYGDLASALANTPLLRGVHAWRPAQVTSISEQADGACVKLADGQHIEAGLVVQAEGGVFAEQASKTVYRNYSQTAIVAQLQCSAALPHRAFERFTDEGPLALLPQQNDYALVWCVRPASAEHLLALPDAAFLAALERAFGSRLGRFTAVTPRAAFPLGLNAHPGITARTVAIGNAAQTLHPVAGQGLNLGLRDAAVLSRILAKTLSADSSRDKQQGLPAALQEFLLERQRDRGMTIRLTDLMARVFASAAEGSISQSLLGGALAAVDILPPAKRLLAEQMMFGRR